MYRGSRSWIEAHEDQVRRAFAIPIKSNNEQSDAIACILLLVGDRDRIGSMRITILVKDFKRLNRCNDGEVNSIALSLASRGNKMVEESDVLAQ